MRENVTASRDFQAVMIPSGEPVLVPAGTNASIMQSLGGSYTLMTDRGLMVRVSGQEVEAIGKTPPEQVKVEGEVTREQLEQMVWDQLRTCFDPEIPVNIVDLGLVYQNEVTPREEGGFDVHVKMTLTAPGCGMGPVLANDVKSKVQSLPAVHEVNAEIVFDPIWDRSMMSEAAKLQLGMYY
jgi:probable FeS assembly SUF system protein SufT